MSRQIQFRRGSSAEHETFTGAPGEITVDTTNNTLRVHDGETAGGTTLAKRSEIPDLTPYDYVIEWQSPTADNNYTWYRKYKSGWVEMGGIGRSAAASSPFEAVFPITMLDTNYTICVCSKSPTSTSADTPHGCHYVSKTKTGIKVICVAGNSGDWVLADISWQICGFAE